MSLSGTLVPRCLAFWDSSTSQTISQTFVCQLRQFPFTVYQTTVPPIWGAVSCLIHRIDFSNIAYIVSVDFFYLKTCLTLLWCSTRSLTLCTTERYCLNIYMYTSFNQPLEENIPHLPQHYLSYSLLEIDNRHISMQNEVDIVSAIHIFIK